MLRKIYTSTLKEILRSPLTIVSCLFLLIVFFFCHGINATDKGGILVPKYGATIYAYTSGAASYVYIICTVIFAVCFLEHEHNAFHDIERVTLMKMPSYLFGKALAYLTFYHGICILLLTDMYYSSYLTQAELFSHGSFPFWPTLQIFCLYYFTIAIPISVVTVGLIMALSGISKNRPIIIIIGISYYLLSQFLSIDHKNLPFCLAMDSYYQHSLEQVGYFYVKGKQMSSVLFLSPNCLLQSISLLAFGICCFLLLLLVYAKRERD